MATNELKFSSPITAALHFFGLKDGQTNLQFGLEWKKLTDEDKAEIVAGLTKLGYLIGK